MRIWGIISYLNFSEEAVVMKKLVVVFAFTAGLSVCSFAADSWTGYIIDKNCSTKKEMLGNEACAKSCIGRGAPAVIATEDGKVYSVSNQDKMNSMIIQMDFGCRLQEKFNVLDLNEPAYSSNQAIFSRDAKLFSQIP